MPRHALRSELAAKLGTTWGGAAGRHVLGPEMPTPGPTGRHALSSEVAAIVAGPVTPTFHGFAQARGFSATNAVGAITGAQVGDLLIAFGAGNDQTTTLTPPSGQGWTEIGDEGGAVAGRMHVFVTTATSTDQAGGTWTWPGTHNHSVAILAYGGVSTPSSVGFARASAATSVVAPSRTSTTDGAILLDYAFFVSNGTAPAWPAGMTVRSPNSGTSATGVGADETRATAGATGTRTFSLGGASNSAAIVAAAVILEHA